MLKRFSQNLLIVCFLAAISAPAVIMLISDRAEFSAHEKRRLASPPQLRWDRSLVNQFPDQFTAFFNDHYGLRGQLVERNQQIRKKLLDKSPTWQVIRGEQDWLFIDRRGSLLDHVGLETATAEELSNWQQQLHYKQNWLKSRGIEYYFVAIPNKMTLYAEYLPPRIREYSGVTTLDRLLAYLYQQDRFLNYTDLEPALARYRDAHPDEPLYFKSDSHWTSQGAFIAYQHIMQQLKQVLPELEPPLAAGQMKRRARTMDGDLANIIDMDRQIEENTFDLVPGDRCASETGKPLNPVGPATQAAGQRTKTMPETNGCALKKYRALVVHDSFGAYLKPFFAESFGHVVFVNNRAQDSLKSIIETEKPDLFLEVVIERNIRSRMVSPAVLNGH